MRNCITRAQCYHKHHFAFRSYVHTPPPPKFCQGGATQMRFQPRLGRILAAASENFVSIVDVETQVCRLKLQVGCRLSWCLFFYLASYVQTSKVPRPFFAVIQFSLVSFVYQFLRPEVQFDDSFGNWLDGLNSTFFTESLSFL